MFLNLVSSLGPSSLRLLVSSSTKAATAAQPSSFHQSLCRMLCAHPPSSSLSSRCSSLHSSSTQQLWQRSQLCSSRTPLPRMQPLHVSSSPRRPLLPLQAAAGGGSGGSAGGGGSKTGYSSGDGSSSGSGGLWESYNKLLGQYPLLVKAITTALLSAVGNLICQLGVEGKGTSDLDWRRFNTFTALGFVWVAPCLHFWFATLNRLVSSPGNAGALMRMGLDQLGFAPLFISSMIGILAAVDGKDLQQCVSVIKRDLPDAIKANWALWVPAQFINFRFVAPTYQVLFANMVALVWNVYFSFATRPKAA